MTIMLNSSKPEQWQIMSVRARHGMVTAVSFSVRPTLKSPTHRQESENFL